MKTKIKWENVIVLTILIVGGFAARYFFGFEAAVIIALAVLINDIE